MPHGAHGALPLAPTPSESPATAAPPFVPAPPPSRAPATVASPPPEHESPNAAWRWAGAIVAGAGVIAIGAAGGVALAAKSNYDSVASQCPSGCVPSAYDVRVNARSQADAASVAMAIGAAAVAGGALLFFLAPPVHATTSGRASRSRAAIGVGAGSLHLALRFD